jgi:hypothetical protein
MDDAGQLFALVRDLGLARYRWLPQMLRFEFDRVTRQTAYRKPFSIEITLPPDLPPFDTAASVPGASADMPLDAMHDDGDGDWLSVATANTPIHEVLAKVDDRTARVLAEFRAARASDPDLTDAERRDVLAYLDYVTPMLRERARADARQAHARLQAEAIADACPASRLTH